jgi:hypothetical protein
MPTVKHIEDLIWRIERFRVRFLHKDGRDVRGDCSGLSEYNYSRSAKKQMTVEAWKLQRIRPKYRDFDIVVLDGGGNPVHGRTLLKTVRASYVNQNYKEMLRSPILEWAEAYLSECYDIGPHALAILDYELIENQILFIPSYVLVMLLEEDPFDSDRIKSFLGMQRITNKDEFLEIHFLEGLPFEVYVLVKSIADLDIADVIALTNFRQIVITRSDSKEWQKESIDSTLKSITDDLEFDGYEPSNISIEDSVSDGRSIDLRIDVGDVGAPTLGLFYSSLQDFQLELANSNDYRVRAMVAGMKGINKQLVEVLSKDNQVNVLLRLVLNTKAVSLISKGTVRTILKRIVSDLDSGIDHPTKLARRLREATESALEGRREGVAWNRAIICKSLIPILLEIESGIDIVDNGEMDLAEWLGEWIDELEGGEDLIDMNSSHTTNDKGIDLDKGMEDLLNELEEEDSADIINEGECISEPTLIIKKGVVPSVEIDIDYIPEPYSQGAWEDLICKITKEWIEEKGFNRAATLWIWLCPSINFHHQGMSAFIVQFGLSKRFFTTIESELKARFKKQVRLDYVRPSREDGWNAFCHIEKGKVWQPLNDCEWIEWKA